MNEKKGSIFFYGQMAICKLFCGFTSFSFILLAFFMLLKYTHFEFMAVHKSWFCETY